MSGIPDLPSGYASRLCTVCDDEVPDRHLVVGHLLTPLTLTVCYDCFTWRDTWDDLGDEYFSAHMDRWRNLRKGFGNLPQDP